MNIRGLCCAISAAACLSAAGCGHDEAPAAPVAARLGGSSAPALRDPSPEARVEAANALGKTDTGRAVPYLVIALDDESPPVREAAAAALAAIGRRALPQWTSAIAARRGLQPVSLGAGTLSLESGGVLPVWIALGAAFTPTDMGVAAESSEAADRADALLGGAAFVGPLGRYRRGEGTDFVRIASLLLEDPDVSVRHAAEALLGLVGWAWSCDRAASSGLPVPAVLAPSEADRVILLPLLQSKDEVIRTLASHVAGRLRISSDEVASARDAPEVQRTSMTPADALADALRSHEFDAVLQAARAVKRSGGEAAVPLGRLPWDLAHRAGLPPTQVATAAAVLFVLERAEAPAALGALRELATAPGVDERAITKFEARRNALLVLASRSPSDADPADDLTAVSILRAGLAPERGIDLSVWQTAAGTVLASPVAADQIPSLATCLDRAVKMPRGGRPSDWKERGSQTEVGVRWAERVFELLGDLGPRAQAAAPKIQAIVASDPDEHVRHWAARALRRIRSP